MFGSFSTEMGEWSTRCIRYYSFETISANELTNFECFDLFIPKMIQYSRLD